MREKGNCRKCGHDLFVKYLFPSLSLRKTRMMFFRIAF